MRERANAAHRRHRRNRRTGESGESRPARGGAFDGQRPLSAPRCSPGCSCSPAWAMGSTGRLAGGASGFDGGRAWEHLRRQVSFGPRPPGSEAPAKTRAYLIDQLRAAGIEAREDRFEADTPNGPITMVNVVATIPGKRPERIALASHYDTKLCDRVPLRRRQRRRVEHGGAARAGPRPARPGQSVLDRAPVLRRRGGDRLGVGRLRQHLRQPPPRRAGPVVRHPGRHARAHPARPDRRPAPEHPARVHRRPSGSPT